MKTLSVVLSIILVLSSNLHAGRFFIESIRSGVLSGWLSNRPNRNPGLWVHEFSWPI